MPSKKNNNKSDPKRSPQNILIIYLLIFTAFLIWNGINLINKRQDEIEIPYTEFIRQIKGENVRKIVIEEDKIKGSFIKAILLSDLAVSSQDSDTGTQYYNQDKDLGKTFMKFETIFPQAIGDTNLLVLLEEHNVIVDVISSSRNKLITAILSWLPLYS